jgi:dTDP-glucose pyrophosphorylase
MNANINIKDAVILAGGKGSRLQKGIDGCSKPMIPILGKRLITFVIDSLIDCGINNIYIIYHSSTADVLTLSTYNDTYSKKLKFIEDLEQKGGLSAFYYVKDIIDVPFIMSFADIIVQKSDFQEMIFTGLNIVNKHPDLLIQTVNNQSIPSEKRFITKGEVVIELDISSVIKPVAKYCNAKSGGMVYLWFKNPFPLIRTFLADGNYRLRQFIQPFVQKHVVLEMPIKDIWDIDTYEDVLQTEKILRLSNKETHSKIV